MDWDHARVFLAVARSGQILAAARKLGLDHATLSRRISALEDSLQTRLFDRHTSGCTLTSPGEDFLSIAERVESEMLHAEQLFGRSSSELAGTVRVGAPDGFGTYFLASELGAFALKHPSLALQLIPLPRVFSLSKGEAEIAITLDRPDEGRLVAKKLTDYGLSVYASRKHLELFGPIRNKRDLASRWLITYVADVSYSRSLDYFGELGALTDRRYECASVVGQLEAVRAGIGVGVLHDYAARTFHDLVPILPKIRYFRTYWIVATADVRKLRRVSEAYEFIVQRVSANRHRFL
jgi:DNA-binding transcriptional LysR family regulator